MTASAIFNADGTMTLLHGINVSQFSTVSSMVNYCNRNGINITRTHTIRMKTRHQPFEVITTKRTRAEQFRDSYSMLRVALSRLMRGDKPRFIHFLSH